MIGIPRSAGEAPQLSELHVCDSRATARLFFLVFSPEFGNIARSANVLPAPAAEQLCRANALGKDKQCQKRQLNITRRRQSIIPRQPAIMGKRPSTMKAGSTKRQHTTPIPQADMPTMHAIMLSKRGRLTSKNMERNKARQKGSFQKGSFTAS
jgi:hypothetical protein